MRILRPVFRWLEHALAVFGLLCLVYLFCFDLSVMVSGSMKPTLCGTSVANGDRVLTDKLTLRLRQPRRWEVVTFMSSEGYQVMKRVVGLPGETLSLTKTVLFVNGVAVERPASLKDLKYYSYGNLTTGKSVQCGDGYFLLGDDSLDSYDSRYTGPIARGDIIGRSWLVVWPRSRIGFVNR